MKKSAFKEFLNNIPVIFILLCGILIFTLCLGGFVSFLEKTSPKTIISSSPFKEIIIIEVAFIIVFGFLSIWRIIKAQNQYIKSLEENRKINVEYFGAQKKYKELKKKHDELQNEIRDID